MNRDETLHRYAFDVEYEVWRNGGNPAQVDHDRVQDAFYDGKDIESATRRELQAQRRKPPEDELVQDQENSSE